MEAWSFKMLLIKVDCCRDVAFFRWLFFLPAFNKKHQLSKVDLYICRHGGSCSNVRTAELWDPKKQRAVDLQIRFKQLVISLQLQTDSSGASKWLLVEVDCCSILSLNIFAVCIQWNNKKHEMPSWFCIYRTVVHVLVQCSHARVLVQISASFYCLCWTNTP